MPVGYEYTPLQEFQVRVLQLLPGSREDPLAGSLIRQRFRPASNEVPEYEALSYVWGDQEMMEPMVLFDSDHRMEIEIGKPLANALRHLRLAERPRQIWCDMLCINQNDLVERAAQVSLMGEIYREADRVVVWLGPQEDDSCAALKRLEYIGSRVYFDPVEYELHSLPGVDQAFGNPSSLLPIDDKDSLAIERLFARSWFTRLWVRQEIVLAKSAVLVVGYSEISWSKFGQAAACIEVKIAFGAMDALFSPRFASDARNIVALFRTYWFRHPVALLNFTRSCQCKDDRDRVYSLLGLMDPWYRVKPDYSKNITGTYKEFMLTLYEKDARLDMLAFCDITASPTWVPNLAGPHPASHFWRNFATGYSEAVFKVLHNDKAEVLATKCGTLSSIIGHFPKECSDDELKQQVKKVLIQQLGVQTEKWDEVASVKITQVVLGGHWFENTNHPHSPPLLQALGVLKDWVTGDTKVSTSGRLLDTLLIWAVHNAVLGWSIYQTTKGLFGLCSDMCQPGDEIYAVLGCKDPILLRKWGNNGHHSIVSPTFVYDFSCGQAIVESVIADSSFVDSLTNPDLAFGRDHRLVNVRAQGLVNVGDRVLEHIGPYKVEDDHPLWHVRSGSREAGSSSSLETITKRDIVLENITLG
jgi:hypothetical protein